MDESRRVLRVLEAYEAESGQQLNKEKTSLFFNKNTKREVQRSSEADFRSPSYPTP